MDINIRIDLTPGTARRLGYVGLSLLVSGIATIAYALPVTFVSKQTLTASQLNQNFEDLDTRLTAAISALEAKADNQQVPIISPWGTYAPTVTTNKGAAVQNQASLGYYRRIGDSLEVRITTTIAAPPQSGSPWWQWGLPDDLTIDLARTGPAAETTIGGGLAQQGIQNFALGPYIRSSKGVSASGAGAASSFINDTTPVAFEAGGVITLFFTVPIHGWTVTQ
jgi:hypothetical protein